MARSDDPTGRTAPRPADTGSRPGVAPPWVHQDLTVVRPSLEIREPATATDIAGMRRTFAGWLAVDVAAGVLLDDLVLAVYEALANVADHAYAGSPAGVGPVRLAADRAHELLGITVSDQGRWRAPGGAPFRNRGLSVIRVLITDVHVETTGSGTAVHLHNALPVPDRNPR